MSGNNKILVYNNFLCSTAWISCSEGVTTTMLSMLLPLSEEFNGRGGTIVPGLSVISDLFMSMFYF